MSGIPSFECDYEQGAIPDILQRLQQTNMVHMPGYGEDEICESARNRIRAAVSCPDAAVYFFEGGTQVNSTALDGMLASYQGALAADTSHIAMHEAGAVEFNGNKVLTIEQHDGKITPEQVDSYCAIYEADEACDHMVAPGVLYLTQPTEFGTMYSLSEFESFRKVCDEHRMKLYVDGARLAYALAAPENDVGLQDLARLCDAFAIGGTKCGALIGEALVVPHAESLPHFFTIIKQHGALLAKGRLLGIQFDELFKDDRYLRVGIPALAAANSLRALFKRHRLKFVVESPTNQIFLELADEQVDRLSKIANFSVWQPLEGGRSIVRFATSWATTEADIRAFSQAFEDLLRD